MIKLMLLLGVLMVSGCASEHTGAINASYYKAYSDHQAMERDKVGLKASAIKDMFNYKCTTNTQDCGAVKALSAVMGAQAIAGIEASAFTAEKPKTDIDAQIQLMKTVGAGIPFATVGVVAYKSVAEDNGSVDIDTNGGNSDYRYSETHATAIDGSTAGATRSGDDNSTVVIKEEEVTDTP